MGSRWQVEKKNDPYYKRAKSEEYRSRASYKLKQLDKKYKIIKEGDTVVDLGAAPGGWSQVALEKVGEEGIVVGVDLNRIKPFHEPNYYGIRGDFTKEIVQEKIHLRSVDLVETVFKIADNILETEGNLVIKAFQGSEYKRLLDSIKYDFRKVKSTKPPSSRQKSKEMYIVGLGYRKGPKRKK